MTYTKLIKEPKEIIPRTHFKVEIKIESQGEALKCAKALREIAKDGRLSCCDNWANELADIFEGKRYI